MRLAVGAAQPHRGAVNRAGEVARHELTLMRSIDVAASLSQVERVV